MRQFLFKRPTASNVEAFVMCGASHALPQHESHNEWAESGTNGHELLCGIINMVPGAGARIEDELPGLAAKLAEKMTGCEGARAEEAYVVDVQKRTSTFLGVNIGRKYKETLGRPLAEYEIGVSLDVRAVKGQKLWIRDFKFGTTSSWWQLYVQCMAVLWLPGCEHTEVDAGNLFISDRDDEIEIEETSASVYMIDLDERADEIMRAFEYAKQLQAQLESGTPYNDLKVVEGKWCNYCGAFPHCPAKWKLAKSMLQLDVVSHVDALTIEQCGDAWAKLAEIKKNIIEKTQDALKVRMRVAGGLPSPDGKLYKLYNTAGRVTVNKEQRAKMITMLREAEYTDAEIAPLMTKGEDYETVRKVNPPKEKKQ